MGSMTNLACYGRNGQGRNASSSYVEASCAAYRQFWVLGLGWARLNSSGMSLLKVLARGSSPCSPAVLGSALQRLDVQSNRYLSCSSAAQAVQLVAGCCGPQPFMIKSAVYSEPGPHCRLQVLAIRRRPCDLCSTGCCPAPAAAVL